MTSALLQSLLKSTGALCALLLVVMFLRAKVPLFRKLLIPASVIGGFLGLLLGPQLWGEAAFLPNVPTYNNFGFEMSQGFNGGHGNAGAVGNILLEAGAPHWEIAQGVASTYATIGLIGGIILGVLLINRASSKGQTVFLKQAAELPASTSYGYTKDVEKQGSLGRETSASSAIETLSIHLGIILIVCGLAYWVRNIAVTYEIIGFEDIPVWPYALLIMYGVNFLLNFFKLDWLIDARVKSHISGAMSDLAITSAIASMPIRAVMTYMLPILITSAIAFVMVYFTTIKMFQLFMPDSFFFERGILSFGINTGVMMTGITLLKICDPDFESPAMEDYSFCYAIRTIIDLLSTPIMYSILAKGTSLQMLIFGIVYTLICYIIVIIGKLMYKSEPSTLLLTQKAA